MVQGAGPAALGRQLGRPGPASTRQLRGLRAGGLEEQVAGGARARALDAFLHGLWIGSAEEILRPLPQGGSDRLGQATEITGPITAKLWVSSTTTDADLFVVVRVFAPDMKEVTFHGALDPHTPVAQGWLRVSHRKLHEELTLPYRPYHTHDEIQELTPGEVYEVDVEVWPTCIVVPRGYRIGLTVRGKDYVYGGESTAGSKTLGQKWTGVGPFRHDDPRDRPAAIFGGDVTLHTGLQRQAYVLLPVIPPK